MNLFDIKSNVVIWMIKVLATDLDGTLFYPKRKISLISGKNKKFLRKFVKEGKKVILVTGRNQNVSSKVAKKIGSKLNLIGCNGGIIIENGQIIKENCISHDIAKKIYPLSVDFFIYKYIIADNFIKM